MRRTEPVRIGDLLTDFRQTPHIARKIAEGKLPEAWRSIAGEYVWSFTRELKLKGVILTVNITSAAVRHEMFMCRASLCEQINDYVGMPLVRELIVK